MPGKRVVWMSQHSPVPSQIAALEKLFPHHELHHDIRSFSGADEIIKRFRDIKGDELVVVAPLSVVREIVKRGVRPLYAEMRPATCGTADAEVTITKGKRQRCYKFVRFSRVHKLEFDLRDPLNEKENNNGNSHDSTSKDQPASS